MIDQAAAQGRPSVYIYNDYRKFLLEIFEFTKLTNSTMSYRAFSLRAGFKSPNYLKMVINGSRNLTPPSIRKVVKIFNLSEKEAQHFEKLVQFNQAKDPETKKDAAKEIIKTRSFQKFNPLTHAEFEYCSKWYYVAIREMANLAEFKEDPDWICRRLEPKILPSEAKRALEHLERLRMLERNPEGRLCPTDRVITTSDDIVRSVIIDYHKQFIELGRDSIERFSKEKREIGALTIAIPKAKIDAFRKIVHEAQTKMLSESNINAENADEIYQFNVQFFPLNKRR